MKYLILSWLVIYNHLSLSGQGFDCDGSAFLIVYTESVGETVLYQVTEQLNYKRIGLSEKRRLTGLAYNVNDKYLYALDVNTYELVQMDRDGMVRSLGVPQNIDQNMLYSSATISANGSTYYMIGHNPSSQVDERFYSINLNRDVLYAGYLAITGDRPVKLLDLAIDPINGTIYGYDQREGRLTFVAVGGSVASGNFTNTGQPNIDGIFFTRAGELIGYSPMGVFYTMDKRTGRIQFAASGPQGTAADACSCPYTYTFHKIIEPEEIVPCEEFTIKYVFDNKLGIGQTWIALTDTFPPGFEIVDIKSKIVSPENKVASPPNILALHNLVYLLRDNLIEVTVKAAATPDARFGSQARQYPFPKAFDGISGSDDPNTDLPSDPTYARIINMEELDFYDFQQYSCDGTELLLQSPILADQYQWSNGATTKDVAIDKIGWISLMAQGNCVYFHDSIFIDSFISPKGLWIVGESEIVAGSNLNLSAQINRGEIHQYRWITDADMPICSSCSTISVAPTENTVFTLTAIDDQGCVTEAVHQVRVEPLKDLYAPTIFSPNGDGINDYFYLSANAMGICRSLTINNRWGAIVYQGLDVNLSQPDKGWDGRQNQILMPSDVYIWHAEIEFADGQVNIVSGSITLINN